MTDNALVRNGEGLFVGVTIDFDGDDDVFGLVGEGFSKILDVDLGAD